MDAPTLGWYFSTMRGRARSGPWTPHAVEFHRTKYGRELLLDAAFVRSMPTFFRVPNPHLLRFHDILLVTRGRGTFRLDAESCRVAPGVVLFTRPGELRAWDVSGLDGACLFFTEEFVAEALADARFLDGLAFFRDGRPSAALELTAGERRLFLARFRTMQREIRALGDDASHALRAVLYELLVLLNRWYTKRHGRAPARPPNAVVERFRRLVDRDHAHRHRVAEYASELGVSPGHLNALCRGDAAPERQPRRAPAAHPGGQAAPGPQQPDGGAGRVPARVRRPGLLRALLQARGGPAADGVPGERPRGPRSLPLERAAAELGPAAVLSLHAVDDLERARLQQPVDGPAPLAPERRERRPSTVAVTAWRAPCESHHVAARVPSSRSS